ncbi:MAG: right-handed parallel beta-helix repeat-containing protein [Planctomycetota bacterium]|nr:right-handed parallel beta-helix repeat-containing protein [Planctomycetota bacterium]
MFHSRFVLTMSLMFSLSLLHPNSLYAADLHVPDQFSTIQGAIDSSNLLDTVLVAPGTYFENLTFAGKSITLRSTGGAAQTIINGSSLTRGPGDGSVLVFEQGESPLAVIDGFTLTAGIGKVITDATGTFSRGGGILISGSSPTLVNCTFDSNTAQLGAGLHASGSVALNLFGLTFTGNNGLEGAGAYLHDVGAVIINGCSFTGNNAQTAGGGLTLDGCTGADVLNSTFDNNNSLIGGGIDAKTTSTQIFDCSFTNNEATLIGGAVTLFQSPSNIVSCELFDNVAGHGAAIGIDGSSVILQRSVIANNFATSQGGAIASTLNSSSINLNHMTLANNNALQGSGGIYLPIDPNGTAISTVIASHSIFWNPAGTAEISIPTPATIDYCDVLGGYPGTVVLNGDPGFTDPALRDYSLLPNSLCIDAGSALSSPDADGTLPDLGAIWHDQRPAAAADLVCSLIDPCTNTYGVTWTLSGGVDAVLISLGSDPNNMTPMASLPGGSTSWTTIINLPGTPTICVEPLNNGMSPANGPTCCQVVVDPIPDPVPTTFFSCTLDHETCTASVNWINGESYTSLQLTSNGVDQAITADATTAILALDQDVATTVALVATTSCGIVLPPVSCELTCIAPPPAPATDLLCSLTDFCTNSYQLSWALSGNVDEVQISVGPDAANMTLAAILPGDATNWPTTLSAGTQVICVEPINNGAPPTTGPTCCEILVDPLPVPVPTADLICSVDHYTCQASLSWLNGEAYSSLQLTVNGVDHPITADATSATVTLAANVPSLILLGGTTVCGEALPELTCELTCIPPDRFIRGDSNADSTLDVSDVMFSLGAVFGQVISSCQDAQDTNDDGSLDISDPLLLLLYLYSGGSQPPAPGLTCGDDPTADALECAGSPGCP